MVFERKFEQFMLIIFFIITTIYLITTIITYFVYVKPKNRLQREQTKDEKTIMSTIKTTNALNMFISILIWEVLFLSIIYWIFTREKSKKFDPLNLDLDLDLDFKTPENISYSGSRTNRNRMNRTNRTNIFGEII